MSQYYRMPPQNQNNDQRQTQQQNTAAPKQTMGKMIFKIALGAIIIVVGLEDLFTDFFSSLVMIIVGAAFVAWGLIPYLEEKRRQKTEETEKILNAKVPGFDEEDEAEKLAKKYYDK
ncbi:MAG: hypothetical protein J5535_06490 [Firmicutes bacterium]|nr:hypothetical protein [Bacillota bacterium]